MMRNDEFCVGKKRNIGHESVSQWVIGTIWKRHHKLSSATSQKPTSATAVKVGLDPSGTSGPGANSCPVVVNG